MKGKTQATHVYELIVEDDPLKEMKTANSEGLVKCIDQFRSAQLSKCLDSLALLATGDPVVELYQMHCNKMIASGKTPRQPLSIVMEQKH